MRSTTDKTSNTPQPNNKFGMFIHWGLYALTEFNEQAMAKLQISHDDYDKLMNQFNPKHYDPEQWVLLAKSVGMKYICFTAKHHDGFCMWDSAYTDYKVTNTPYGKDVLKQLADACHKHGMLLSIYYSNPDWHHPCGYNPNSTHQYCPVNPDVVDLETYKQYIKDQITELLTNYGQIYTLFWDIPPQVRDESINKLVRKLQPNIYINNRGWDEGDFSTPERDYEEIAGKRFEHMTEACNSVGVQSWGYCKNEDFYSLRYLTTAIDRTMAMGGSYLLNVGPDADGQITAEYAQRLQVVGNWFNRMDGCLENAQNDDFDYGANEFCIANVKDGKTYLHFCNGISANAVYLKNFPTQPQSITLLNTHTKLPCEVCYLPTEYDENAVCRHKFLRIYDIPIDSLQNEPIVLQIEW